MPGVGKETVVITTEMEAWGIVFMVLPWVHWRLGQDYNKIHRQLSRAPSLRPHIRPTRERIHRRGRFVTPRLFRSMGLTLSGPSSESSPSSGSWDHQGRVGGLAGGLGGGLGVVAGGGFFQGGGSAAQGTPFGQVSPGISGLHDTSANALVASTKAIDRMETFMVVSKAAKTKFFVPSELVGEPAEAPGGRTETFIPICVFQVVRLVACECCNGLVGFHLLDNVFNPDIFGSGWTGRVGKVLQIYLAKVGKRLGSALMIYYSYHCSLSSPV